MQAEELTAEFGIAGVLDFVETEHGLVKAAISLDGISGELYLQGAHLTAWQPPGERPVLFTSPNSAFAPGRAIRGGIPIIFPWFGANRHEPAAPQHGFARTASWQLDGVETRGSQSLTLTFSLGDGDVGSPAWLEPFRAIYTVTFAQTLSLRLTVQNRATRPTLLRDLRYQHHRDLRVRRHHLHRQDRRGTAQGADRRARHHHGRDRQGLPRYAGAMRH